MTMHTPGPWVLYVNKLGGNWEYQIRTAKPHNPAGELGKHVADCNAHLRTEDGKNLAVEANGHMLAAAPDLYTACSAMLAAWDEGLMNYVGRAPGNALQAMREAIAKAEGR